jgi:asparagine synthase (glutamine-hydrolysing)
MYVVLAWFADRSAREDLIALREGRFAATADPLIPESYDEYRVGGRDWGVSVRHSQPGRFHWPVVASEGRTTAISLGLPLGIETSGGPVALADRLLRGEDVHAEVLPPFTLMALEADERFAIQQDWLGMGRLFTASDFGITVFCNRPSLIAAFLWGRREPDVEGWRSYAVTGHFGGNSSPIRGVRLMQPGERVTGQCHPDEGWRLTSRIGTSVDDLVADGLALQAQGPAAAVEQACDGLLKTVRSLDDLYAGDITLGLSGGKDSRLVAASFLAAGSPVKFFTNVDDPAEGETAQHLVRIVRARRGLELTHLLERVADPADVLATGLFTRGVRLQALYDYQFPSSYLARTAAAHQLPVPRTVSFSGVGGELAVGYWYPQDASRDLDQDEARSTAVRRLNMAVPASMMAPGVYDAEAARVGTIVDRGEELGLQGQAVTDYVYLVERVRRWYSSAYHFGVVTPFLSPAFVTASFALAPEHKRQWLLHRGALDRFAPEWSDVPFITGVAPARSTAAAIWDGDGAATIAGLLDTVGGPLTATLRPAAVRAALAKCRAGAPPAQRQPPLLQQFAALAVATHSLLPDMIQGDESLRPAAPAAPPPTVPEAPPKPPPTTRSRVVRSTRRRLGWAKHRLLG